MKLNSLFLAIFSSIILLFTSCEKNEGDQPVLLLDFETVTSELNLKSAAANSLVFTEGQIILGEVEFETESDTDSIQVDFEIETYIIIDFATGETTPDLSGVELVPGNYTEIDIELELWDESELPSIALDGTWTDSENNPHPVKLLMPSGQSFSLEIEGNYSIDENTSMIAQVTIDPTAWFAGVTNALLAAATVDENGVIIISPEHNSAIYDIVEDQLDMVSEVEIEM